MNLPPTDGLLSWNPKMMGHIFSLILEIIYTDIMVSVFKVSLFGRIDVKLYDANLLSCYMGYMWFCLILFEQENKYT